MTSTNFNPKKSDVPRKKSASNNEFIRSIQQCQREFPQDRMNGYQAAKKEKTEDQDTQAELGHQLK
ncbi:MAG: hypothetical protein D3923_12735 [Candidatus Electrothrix sp. AR3]|nr:hypothetical protein [Candidatus Electrothrix sp. AR3]